MSLERSLTTTGGGFVRAASLKALDSPRYGPVPNSGIRPDIFHV